MDKSVVEVTRADLAFLLRLLDTIFVTFDGCPDEEVVEEVLINVDEACSIVEDYLKQ